MVDCSCWIRFGFPLAPLLFLFAQSTANEVDEKPNIILMMADDLGYGDAGYRGHPHLKTPHLDAMAKASLQFDRFYSAAPVCSPTRGSCLTGRHPYRYGITNANVGHMPAREITLAELLREKGYATGHFGKWHVGTLTTEEKDANRGGPNNKTHFSPPWENGFDLCFSTESKVPTFDPLLRPASAKGNTWWNPAKENEATASYGTAYWVNGQKAEGDLRGDDSRLVMDHALEFIEQASGKDQPFFTIIWFHAPHLPVVAGPEYTKLYADHDSHRQHYWGCITALDEQVGRLRAKLRELNEAENTIIWFCSDNGPEGNDNAPGSSGGLRGRKRSLFEGGVRVPGLCEWPALVKAGKTSLPACTSDYLPTLLAILEIEPPAVELDGVNLLPLLKGEMKERPKEIAFESGGQLSLVGNRYKLIHAGGKNKQKFSWMLFDLEQDPAETTDLAASHPQIVNEMAARLLDWQKKRDEN